VFNSIRGTVTGRSGDAVFLFSGGGLEWEIAMPESDIAGLPEGECRVFTWLYHREDTMRLFGFCNEKRRSTFLELLKVEGIGPKGALKIMGGIGQGDLEQALETGDLARLEAVPGLGKKTAQKMLLALKGKLVSSSGSGRTAGPHSDLVNALAEMGYDRRAAADAIAKAESLLPEGAGKDEKEKLLFKNAIVYLSGGN
jgi:Holliday junction DNA helicase RuvA